MTITTWCYRGGVLARTVAAIGGGYMLTSIAIALIALALPLPRADAVTLATLPSFVLYTCVILWVFATTSAWRAWGGVLVACAVLGGLLWFVGRAA